MSAVVLAGGRSSRMGRDKRDIELRGRTLLDRAVVTLKALTDDIVITVRDGPVLGDPRSAVRDGPVRGAALRTVRDEVFDRGPLGGVLTGLRHIRHPRALVVPVDMPLLSPAFLAYLGRESAGWDVTVPRWAAGVEPLVGVYAARCVRALERFLTASFVSARDFVRSMAPAVRYVEEEEIRGIDDPATLFLNVNTPKDVRQAARVLQRREVQAAPPAERPEGARHGSA